MELDQDTQDQTLAVTAPSTVGDAGRRIWLYPDRRNGPRASRRRNIAIALIIFYLTAPFVTIGGEPLLRFDVLAARVSIFGKTFRYTDAAFMFFIFAGLAIVLFLVTSLRGRIWCGYACPQTVFTEWVIRPLEELIEGDFLKRRKLDEGPWTLSKVLRKGLKHSLFIVVGITVANVFLSYFIPPETLIHWITSSPASHPRAFGFMCFVMLIFYFDLSWFREQFCTFLCPYARFQSVMVDERTPIVSYDVTRGEPRGKAKGSGDCIDCGLCVRVCPTGIDIRKGLQLECIACERCMDACDGIMGNLKRPLGLIRNASQLDIQKQPVQGWFRPRVFIYSFILIALLVGLSVSLFIRGSVNVSVVRAPGVPFARLSENQISNIFVLHAENNAPLSTQMKVTLLSPDSAQLICGACNKDLEAFGEERINIVVVFDAIKTPKNTVAKIRFEGTGKILDMPLLSP